MDSVATAFELMALELGAAVEDLNAEGARLVKSSNYLEARRLIDKGLALKDFCERVQALSAEWIEKYAQLENANESLVDAGETARRILSAAKAPRTGLLVRFPDETVICEQKAADTLVKAIEKIGFTKVETLRIVVNHENLVSRQKSQKYNEVHVPPFYVKTHSSTEQKKKNLDKISDELGLGLQVTILD